MKRQFVAGAIGALGRASAQTDGGLTAPRGFESRSLHKKNSF